MSRKPSFANLRTNAPRPVAPAAPEVTAEKASGRASRAKASAPPPALTTPTPAPVVAAPQPEAAPSAAPSTATPTPGARPESRVGRKQIAGFFTPEMSFAMHMLARRQGRSLQSLMAEAFNDVLRKHGESPIGD